METMIEGDDFCPVEFFYYFNMHGKLFFLHLHPDAMNEQSLIFWIQIWGSKFEAKNYKCSIQVGDSTHGHCLFNFKGPIKSLDEDKNDAFAKQYGLIVSLGFVQKLIYDDHSLSIEVEIEDLKAEEQTDFDEPMEATTANDDKNKKKDCNA